MSIYNRLFPLLSLFVLVVLAVLPWGLSPTGRLAMALLPGVAILSWSSRPQRSLSVLSVFGCGIVLDVLSGAALGHWALVYLVAFGASSFGQRAAARVFGIELLLVPGVVFLMLAAIWGLAAFAFGGVGSVWVSLGAGGLAVLSYPVVSGVLGLLDRSRVNDSRGVDRLI